MSAPIARLLSTTAPDAPEDAKGAELSPAPDQSTFWQEFVRVQCDKFLLLGLVVFMHFAHMDAQLQATALGGLIILIQGQRFKR
jgi:hypothetical protein